MKIRNYYIEHTIKDGYIRFTSLKKAVEYGIQHKDNEVFSDMLLITIGGYNLTKVHKSDTFESLYNRCKEAINTIKQEF